MVKSHGGANELGIATAIGAAAKMVQADPVVAWDLRAPAQGVVTVGYLARVPAAGVARSRLLR